MEKVLEFLKEARPCFVTTVDGDEPRVRPQGFHMEYDGKLLLCTADGKASSKELKRIRILKLPQRTAPSLSVSAEKLYF